MDLSVFFLLQPTVSHQLIDHVILQTIHKEGKISKVTKKWLHIKASYMVL